MCTACENDLIEFCGDPDITDDWSLRGENAGPPTEK